MAAPRERRTAGSAAARRPAADGPRPGGRPKSRREDGGSALGFSLWLALGALVVIADQATKFYFEHAMDPGDVIPVCPGFNFVLAHNRGAAFSFLADAGGWQTWLFSILALAVVAAALRLLWKHSAQKLFSLALTLIAAGAIGNFLDRSLSGYVVDFIDLYWRGWHWPAFNVADIAICAGAAGIVIDELRGVSRGR